MAVFSLSGRDAQVGLLEQMLREIENRLDVSPFLGRDERDRRVVDVLQFFVEIFAILVHQS